MFEAIKSVLFSALMLPILANAATLTGTVTSRASAGPIQGAKVTLGSMADSDTTTNAQGNYSFTGVATGFHSVVATMTGYQTSTSELNAFQQNGNYTVNIPLVASIGGGTTGLISGTVTDFTSKEALSGVKVLLCQRVLANGNGIWRGIETLATKGDGTYGFDSLAAGTYSILASKTDHISKTSVNIALSNSQKDTMDITLTKIAKGAMSILVGLDSTGNAPLASVAVAASSSAPNGEVNTGTTDAKG